MIRDAYESDSEQITDRRAGAGARRWSPEERDFTPEEIDRVLRPGMTIWDRAGNKVGAVRAVYTPIGVNEFNADPYNVVVRVDRAFPAGDLFIPARFIGHIVDGGARLTITEGEMQGLDWQKPKWVHG